jgi:SPP1 family predicted phage head-tail adaptor
MMDDVLILISQNMTADEYGIMHPVLSRKKVFCKVGGITRSEFYNAGRSGLNPDFMFTVFAGDYSGESLCEYRGKTYSIYRTYINNADYIELYVQREGGSNGKESNGQ